MGNDKKTTSSQLARNNELASIGELVTAGSSL